MRFIRIGPHAVFAVLWFTPPIVHAGPFLARRNNTSMGLTALPFNLTSNGQNYTYYSNSSATSTKEPPEYVPLSQPALLPDVHWDEPISDVQNLAPSTKQRLYYSSNGASNAAQQHTFAQVHTNTSHPSVVLAHSQYVQGVTCNANGLHIDMVDAETLAYAQSTWLASLPMIIVTFAEGCGDSADQRAFWLVNRITSGSAILSEPGKASGSDGSSGSGSNPGRESNAGSGSSSQSGISPNSGYNPDHGSNPAHGSSSDNPSSGSRPISGDILGSGSDSGSGSLPESGSSSGSPSNVIYAAIQQQLSIGDAMPEVEVVWGTYQPNNNTAHTGSSKSSPQDSHGGNGGTRNYSMGNATHAINGISAINGTNATCGAPPSRMIDGFYTATCGSPTFDQDIDNEIGFLDFDSSDYSASLKDFAPGLADDDSAADNEDFGPTEGRRAALKRRSFFKSFGNFISSAAKFVAKAGDAFVSAAKQVGNAISNALAITPNASADIPINVAPSGLVDSPFGQAKQIYSKQKASANGVASGSITVYCVDCGVQGVVHLHGQARFTIADGLTQANAGMNGNIAAGLEIGIDANAEISDTLRYPIVSAAVPPGFSVPGIFAVGPVVSLDAELELGITLAGQVLAGVKMTIPNFSANLDLVDSSKSAATGFTPQFEKIFQAKTAITATAALGLPLGIGLGIDIPPLKFRKTAALYEKPSIGATITYSGSTNGQAISGDNTCLNGIAYSLQFGNDIYADFFGITKVNINSLKVPIAGSCIPLGGGSTTAVATPGSGANQTGTTTDAIASGTTDAAIATEGANNDGTGTSGGTETPPAVDQSAQRRAIFEFLGSGEKVALKRQENGSDGAESSNASDDSYSYVDSDDQDEGANNSDFDELSGEAIAEAESDDNAPTANDTGVVDDPGSSFVYINDATNSYGLEADPITGNIYIGDPGEGSLFASSEGNIVGDDAGRYFHYYPDLMNAYNVSRFRLSNETQIPKDADFVALVPVDYNNSSRTPDVYAAFDTSGNVFLTITCDIEGEFSKVFLAQDVEEGIKALMNPHLKYTVTGGIVTSCYYLPFVASLESTNTTSNATSS